MEDPNVYDQLVVVPKLAEQLVCDHSFIYEIGLDEFSHDEKIQKLSLVIGFVLAMYNTALSVFRSNKSATLDDKFIEVIYSRICLMPELIQSRLKLRDYAKECYSEAKRKSDESGRKWNDMTLHEQFFEICVCVFQEEIKLDRPDLHALMPKFEEVSSHSIMTTVFHAVFSRINWELGNEVEFTESAILSPKKVAGSGSLLKYFPLQRRTFNKLSLLLAIVVGVLFGSLTVRHLVMKYAAVQAAGDEYRKATQLYMQSAIKAFNPNDTNAQNLKREAWQKLERCDRRLKEYEGFWVKYENDWWHVLSKGSFFTICVLSGFGATAAGFLTIWLLHTLSQMSKKAKQQKLYGRYDNSNDYTPSPHRYAGTDEQ